jgi:hypothetical protein
MNSQSRNRFLRKNTDHLMRCHFWRLRHTNGPATLSRRRSRLAQRILTCRGQINFVRIAYRTNSAADEMPSLRMADAR